MIMESHLKYGANFVFLVFWNLNFPNVRFVKQELSKVAKASECLGT